MNSRKQIIFDLDTKVLKQIFGENKYTQAYYDIKSFMLKKGFEHIEGSAYASIKGMANYKVLETLRKLKRNILTLIKALSEYIKQT